MSSHNSSPQLSRTIWRVVPCKWWLDPVRNFKIYKIKTWIIYCYTRLRHCKCLQFRLAKSCLDCDNIIFDHGRVSSSLQRHNYWIHSVLPRTSKQFSIFLDSPIYIMTLQTSKNKYYFEKIAIVNAVKKLYSNRSNTDGTDDIVAKTSARIHKQINSTIVRPTINSQIILNK